ncbi:hypothetical protein MMC19_006271 [Ptychographa xylographoides]|nr:hypothetical protein [Ptychographa xylographoides]
MDPNTEVSLFDIFIDFVSFLCIACGIGGLTSIWLPMAKEVTEHARAGVEHQKKWTCTSLLVLTICIAAIECVLFFRFIYTCMSSLAGRPMGDQQREAFVGFGVFGAFTLVGVLVACFEIAAILLEMHHGAWVILACKSGTASDNSAATLMSDDIEAQRTNPEDNPWVEMTARASASGRQSMSDNRTMCLSRNEDYEEAETIPETTSTERGRLSLPSEPIDEPIKRRFSDPSEARAFQYATRKASETQGPRPIDTSKGVKGFVILSRPGKYMSENFSESSSEWDDVQERFVDMGELEPVELDIATSRQQTKSESNLSVLPDSMSFK